MNNTIVIVDDNEALLDVCAQVLRKQGFHVEIFTEVVKAKQYLMAANENSIYAIISDLIMSPTDGLDFLSFVRSVPKLDQTDFFLMTGALAVVFEPYYRSCNLKGIIQKPFNANDLKNALNIADQKFAFRGAA